MRYDHKKREEAEEIYVYEGKSFEEVARITGVSRNQLISWGKEGKWREKRKEYLASQEIIRARLISLRLKMTEEALRSLDPQKIYSVVKLESLMRQRQEEKSRLEIALDVLEVIVEVLKEVDPGGLKILKRNQEALIRKLMEHYGEETKA